jgi:urease accessory protein UreE
MSEYQRMLDELRAAGHNVGNSHPAPAMSKHDAMMCDAVAQAMAMFVSEQLAPLKMRISELERRTSPPPRSASSAALNFWETS